MAYGFLVIGSNSCPTFTLSHKEHVKRNTPASELKWMDIFYICFCKSIIQSQHKLKVKGKEREGDYIHWKWGACLERYMLDLCTWIIQLSVSYPAAYIYG